MCKCECMDNVHNLFTALDMSAMLVGPAEPASICQDQNYLFYLMEKSSCRSGILLPTDNLCK